MEREHHTVPAPALLMLFASLLRRSIPGFASLSHAGRRTIRVCLLTGSLLPVPLCANAQKSASAILPEIASSADNPPAAAQQLSGSEGSFRKKRAAEDSYLKGVQAMGRGDVQGAESAFARAVQQDPSNQEYRTDLDVAREFGVTHMVQEADKAKLLGNLDAARADLAKAIALDPKNPVATQHMDELSALSLPSGPIDDITPSIAPPIELMADPGKHTFHLRGTEQQVLQQVLSSYGLVAVTDSSVDTKTIRFDADDVPYQRAAALVSLATGSFLVPLDPKRVLAAKDTKDNHTRYDRLALETLRLPGLSTTEMNDMGNIARTVLGVERATVQADAGTLTVRAPHSTLVALNQTLEDLLEGRSEVMLDVRLLEVDRTRTMDLGLQTPQTASVFNLPSEVNGLINGNQSLVQQIISSGLASSGDTAAIAAILIASGQVSSSLLSQPFAVFGGGLTQSAITVGAVQGNLSFNSTDTRSLDQVQLRLEDQEEGTIRVGTRYPIETSNYSSIGASSVSIPGLTSAGLSSSLAGLGINLNSLASSATIPQIQYQDLGLTLKMTPRVEGSHDVGLKFDFKITALQGSTLNGLPVLSNESYTADTIVTTGASVMLMTNLSSSESKVVSGIPGLSDLPGFQSTTNSSTDVSYSSLVIVVTPHLVRRRHEEQAGPFVALPQP